jgi:translocator protein
MLNPLKLLLSLLIVSVAAAIGSLVTYPNIAGWYADLNKPFFNPPNWIFGPVWTVLYVCMGLALYLVWARRTKHSKEAAYVAFACQLGLNVLWSIVFFGLHHTVLGVAVILVLFMTIIITNRLFWPLSRLAAWLLVPYSLWVCYATALNVAIALMN